MSDGIWVLDGDCRLIFLNRAAFAMLAAENTAGEEFSRAILIGREVRELLPNAFGTRLGDECLRALRQATPVVFTEFYSTSALPSPLSFEVEISPDTSGLTVVTREAANGRTAITDAIPINEERLKQSVRVAGLGIFDHDHLRGTIHWSPEMYIIFGWESEPESVAAFAKCLHPDDRERVLTGIAHAHDPAGDGLYASEHRIIWPDGQVRWVSIQAQTFFGSDGNGAGRRPLRTIGAALDITERHKAEEDLHAVLTNTRCILWHADVWADPQQDEAALAAGVEPWHNFRWFTRAQDEHAAQQVLPLEVPDDLNYADCWVLSRHPDDTHRMNVTARLALIANTPNYSQEFRCFDKFGRMVWLHEETVIVPVRPGHWQLFGVATDVTERKRAEELLSQNAALFSAIVEQAPTGVYVVDSDFRLQQVNALAQPVFATVRRLIGRDFNEVMEILWGPEVGRRCTDVFRHTLATGERYISPRFSEQRQDIGVEQAYQWETQRVTMPDGRPGVVCYFQDVTARNRHEQNLAFLDDMQKGFSAISSEEIMREAAERLADHLGLTHCMLVEINATADECTVLHDHHPASTPSLVGHYRLGDFHPDAERRLLESGGTLVIDDVRRDSRSAERVEQFATLGIGALVNASYVADGRWKFVLSAARPKPYTWPEEDIKLLGEVAARIYLRLERARAEEKLREREEHLRLFIEHAPAALAMFDREMRYLSVSQRWLRDNGLDGRDLRGHSYYEIFPEVPARWKEIHRRALDGEVISSEQDLFERADGSTQWLKWEVRPWRDAGGAVSGILIFSEDITARKSIEEEFRLASERFAAALKASPVTVFNQDLDLRYTWMHNPVFGLASNDVLGKRGADLVDSVEEAAESDALKRRVLESGRGERAQITLYAQGKQHYFDMTVEPLRDAEGQITGVTCAAVDITEQRQLQENLRRQAHLLDEAHDAIFAWELDGTIVYWNQGAERLYGYSAAEALGKVSHDLLQSAPAESLKTIFEALERDGVWMGEVEHYAHDGRRFPVASRHSLVREDDGHVLVIEANRDITQQKRAEQELRDSEERFRATFEQAAVGIAMLDCDGKWLRVNQRLCNIVGYSREELLTKTFSDITHPDDLEPDWVLARSLLAGEINSFQMEKRYVRKDGTPIWTNLTAALRRRPDGTPDYFISVVEDISSRKQIEWDLRDSEARFRRVSEMISDYAYELRVSPDGSVTPVWFTDALPRITGRSPAELHQPDSWLAFLHPDDLPLAEAHRAALLRGEADSCEFRVIATDGSVHWLRDYGQPLFDESGRIVGIHGGAQEMTERKKTERAAQFLAAASPLLSASLDAETTLKNLAQLCVPELADLCMIYIEEGDTTLHVVRHTQPDKEDLVRRFHQRFPKAGPPLDALRAGQSVLRTRILPEGWQQVAQSPEHLEMLRGLQPRSILMVPLLTEHGFVGFITLSITESERRFDEHDRNLAEEVARRASVAIERARLFHQMQAAREAAEAANRTKDEFLSVASHELRTPLTPILGWVDIMRGPMDETLKMHALGVLERNVRAQMQLVDDILDVSRITTDKLRLTMQPLDLSPIVTGAVDSLWPTASARSLKLFVADTDREYWILGDAGRLQQVVWNLLSNAIKFSTQEGAIEVELRQEDEHAVVAVRDQGVGISPHFLPYVFERFRQADSSHTRQHGGLGLGLSIARHITELHGGTVHAASEGEGRGATFTVRLPLLDRDAAPMAAE